MTVEELYAIIQKQQKEIDELKKLAERVKYDESYYMELINNLTESTNFLLHIEPDAPYF